MSEITFESLAGEHRKHVIFRGVWGSHAYGTSTPESDRDSIGVFILPRADYLSLRGAPAQISDASNDNRFYSLKNYCELAARANPNLLDSLFLPPDCVLYATPYWEKLQRRRRLFLSRQAGRTYCEYALAQIRKARGCNKRVYHPQPEKPPEAEEFCRFLPRSAPGMPARPLRLSDAGITLAHCHAAAVEQSSELFRLYDYGADARGVFRNGMLVCESIPAEDENSRFLGLLLFNRNAFEKARSEHRHYWEWRRNRNENRWRTQESGELDYDAKNLMHTFRLLYSGIHILKTGEPLVRFSGGQLRTLREIRRGVFSFEELQNQAAILVGELETLRHSSALPEEADRDAIDRLLLEITTQWENDHAE